MRPTYQGPTHTYHLIQVQPASHEATPARTNALAAWCETSVSVLYRLLEQERY